MNVRGSTFLAVLCVAGLTGTTACGANSGSTPTAPTPTTPTAADPLVTESFAGTLTVNGSRFYAFEVGTYGTVNVTLQNVGGVTGVPDTVWVGLGIGVPDGTDCSTTTSLNTQAGSSPQVSSVVEAGIYCARVYDVGNLAAPTAFAIGIAHP
jgi:hypothetical protein